MNTYEKILVVAAVGAFGYILYSIYTTKTVNQQLASDFASVTGS